MAPVSDRCSNCKRNKRSVVACSFQEGDVPVDAEQRPPLCPSCCANNINMLASFGKAVACSAAEHTAAAPDEGAVGVDEDNPEEDAERHADDPEVALGDAIPQPIARKIAAMQEQMAELAAAIKGSRAVEPPGGRPAPEPLPQLRRLVDDEKLDMDPDTIRDVTATVAQLARVPNTAAAASMVSGAAGEVSRSVDRASFNNGVMDDESPCGIPRCFWPEYLIPSRPAHKQPVKRLVPASTEAVKQFNKARYYKFQEAATAHATRLIENGQVLQAVAFLALVRLVDGTELFSGNGNPYQYKIMVWFKALMRLRRAPVNVLGVDHALAALGDLATHRLELAEYAFSGRGAGSGNSH